MYDLPKETLIESAEISQDALIELFILDLTHLGGDLFRFHAGFNEIKAPIKWQGEIYTPYGIMAEGFESTSQGVSNRPTLTVANVGGLITGLREDYDDLAGAILTRKRMYARFLDADNFIDGNPHADPIQEIVTRYEVERVINLEASFAKIELALPCETDGALIPARVIIADTCNWIYRGAECSYTGGAVADEFDNPTTDISCDKCGKRLTSCKLRFGKNNPLPFGGFPSVSKMSR